MSRKRPTEASWDSDDDLLNEDTSSFTAVRSNRDFDDDLDEDALLGSDDEAGNNNSKSSVKASQSGGKVTPGKSIGTVISSVNKRTEKRPISPVKWQTKMESKPSDLILEDEIELLDPDVEIGFDTFDAGDISQQEDQSYTDHFVEETGYDQQEDADTTHEKFPHEEEASHGESDESEDEGEKRGGRFTFKSERQNIVTVTSKPSITSEIPDTLEISDEQQKQINEFMSQKDKKKRPFRPSNQFQQNREHSGRIQTITSTSGYSQQQSQPTVVTQQPPVFSAPPVISGPPPLMSAGQGRPKIYMNPHFKRGKSSSPSRNGHQPPPLIGRPPSTMYRHEPSPPRHQYEPSPPRHQYEPSPPRHQYEHPPPLMEQYRHDRPPYSHPPPHHHMPPPLHGPPNRGPPHLQQGPPPSSQHYPAPLMNSPPRFQHQPEPRPLFDRPPPQRFMDGYGGFHQPPPRQEQYYPPPHHSQQPRHPRPLFPPPHSMDSSVGPRNPFNNHHQHEVLRPEHYNHPPRPNLSAQDFPPRMQMHQPRNNMYRPRQPLLRGQQNTRFQAPRPTLQQQQSKKILQKARDDRAKKFSSIQNIPVIGRQATKRPSTDEEGVSPPKAIKTETAESIGLTQEESYEYIKKMEQQKTLRAEILRKKELKRQTDAARRRKELEEKLKKEGKNIAELERMEEPTASNKIASSSQNIGRGQMTGQQHPTNIGRGQRGYQVNMGRGQQTFQANTGRGGPANAGRGQISNIGRGQDAGQGQFVPRGRGQQRGRGQLIGGTRGGKNKLKQGQTHIIDGSGKAELVKSYTTFNPGHGKGRGNNNSGQNSPRHVLEPKPLTRQEIGDKPAIQIINEIAMKRALLAQGNVAQTIGREPNASNQQVNVALQGNHQGSGPRLRRMKKVVRTKKNAKGEILSTETLMIPLDDDESVLPQVSIATPLLTSPVMSPVLSSPEPQRVVVNSSGLVGQEESQRTVIASSVLGDGRRNIVMDDSPDHMSRKVCIENLSLSTADSSVKRMCGCVGPIQNFQRFGKSAYVTFIEATNAIRFVHKYNRHMVDLSHISVKSIPE